MSVHLGQMTWPETEELIRKSGIAVVPTSAFEQHGHHLPLDTDARLAGFVAEEACRKAQAQGVPVVMTPPIWTGFSPHHMKFPGSITLSLETFHAIVREVCTSLWHHGFRKILLLNGHGGNSALLRSITADLRFTNQVRVTAASYWDFVIPYIRNWRESEPGGIDHACEMETALLMHLSPELVKEDEIREAIWFPKSKYLTGDLTIGGVVSTSFDLAEITPEGVAGDPTLATAERGQKLFDEITKSVADFLAEFEKWDWDNPKEI